MNLPFLSPDNLKMSVFPLYDNLSNQIEPDTDVSLEDKQEFIQRFKKCNKAGYELIYALIRFYHKTHNDGVSTIELPYGGKNQKNGIKFDLERLPINLQKMLCEFLKIHLKSQEED